VWARQPGPPGSQQQAVELALVQGGLPESLRTVQCAGPRAPEAVCGLLVATEPRLMAPQHAAAFAAALGQWLQPWQQQQQRQQQPPQLAARLSLELALLLGELPLADVPSGPPSVEQLRQLPAGQLIWPGPATASLPTSAQLAAAGADWLARCLWPPFLGWLAERLGAEPRLRDAFQDAARDYALATAGVRAAGASSSSGPLPVPRFDLRVVHDAFRLLHGGAQPPPPQQPPQPPMQPPQPPMQPPPPHLVPAPSAPPLPPHAFHTLPPAAPPGPMRAGAASLPPLPGGPMSFPPAHVVPIPLTLPEVMQLQQQVRDLTGRLTAAHQASAEQRQRFERELAAAQRAHADQLAAQQQAHADQLTAQQQAHAGQLQAEKQQLADVLWRQYCSDTEHLMAVVQTLSNRAVGSSSNAKSWYSQSSAHLRQLMQDHGVAAPPAPPE
jgi:hypothetical protein